jgi:putative membrane protein
MLLQASSDIKQIRRRRIHFRPEYLVLRLAMNPGLYRQVPLRHKTLFFSPDNPSPRFRISYMQEGNTQMKTVLSIASCLALCCLTASAQGEHAKGAPMPDQKFLNMAAQTDMMEANLGQMAADHAASQNVKDYASMLVTDHTADYQQLGVLAAKASLTVPTALDAAHNKMIAPFEKLKGAAFDSRYIHEMIAGHTEAIGVYTKESTDAQNSDVKSYASATLPTLQKHLDGAKDLLKKPSPSK